MAEKRRAIVVDDEPITRIDLRQMLTEMGFTVVGEAADGFDAIALCRRCHPDVVLMDIKMPVFDGMTASETLIREEAAFTIYRMYLTNHPFSKNIYFIIFNYWERSVMCT